MHSLSLSLSLSYVITSYLLLVFGKFPSLLFVLLLILKSLSWQCNDGVLMLSLEFPPALVLPTVTSTAALKDTNKMWQISLFMCGW